MKKVLFALGAFGFMATAAAEDAPAEDERQQGFVEEGLLPGGFYYGLGLGIANVGVRNEYTYGTAYKGYTDDGGLYHAEAPSGSDAGYTEDEVNAERTRLGGAFVVGFGRKLPSNNLFLALEVGVDFTRNTTFAEQSKFSSRGRGYDVKVVRNGFTPFLGARIGYVACKTGILTYLKVGGTLLKLKEHYYEYSTAEIADIAKSEHKLSQVVPTLGIGLEKAFAPKLTGRLECEYQFNKSKVKDFGKYGSTKLSSKGDIVVRVMFCHNLKVGI